MRLQGVSGYNEARFNAEMIREGATALWQKSGQKVVVVSDGWVDYQGLHVLFYPAMKDRIKIEAAESIFFFSDG